MGGSASRLKGKVFEREVATAYRSKWPRATVRRALQSHAAFEPDVVIEGDAPGVALALWTECQHAAKPTPLAKLEQAERDVSRAKDAGIWFPIVVWRKHGERRTQATMRMLTLSALDLVDGVATGTETLVVTMDFDEFLEALD